MINLIPKEAHLVIRHEYRYRVIGTFSFLFGVVFLIFGIALIPKYILINTQIKEFELDIEKESGKASTVYNYSAEIERSNLIIGQLKKQSFRDVEVTTFIREIEKIAPPDITFRGFSVKEGDNASITAIEVQGTAPTRESLALFKENVKQSPLFESAEVPLSDLARKTEIPFTSTLKVEQKK